MKREMRAVTQAINRSKTSAAILSASTETYADILNLLCRHNPVAPQTWHLSDLRQLTETSPAAEAPIIFVDMDADMDLGLLLPCALFHLNDSTHPDGRTVCWLHRGTNHELERCAIYARSQGEALYVVDLEKQGSQHVQYLLNAPNLPSSSPRAQACAPADDELVCALLSASATTLQLASQHSLVDGHITALHATIRWQHDTLGEVSAQALTQSVHRLGLDDLLIHKMLLQVVALQRKLLESGYRVPIKIEISPATLCQHATPQALRQYCESQDVDPSLLVLSLTPQIADFPGHLLAFTACALRKHGFSLAIENFDLTMSMLSHLSIQHGDTLCISPALSHDMTDPASKRIIRAIVSLAHATGIKTLVSELDTAEQLEQARLLGCDLGQGLALSPYRSTDVLRDYLG